MYNSDQTRPGRITEPRTQPQLNPGPKLPCLPLLVSLGSVWKPWKWKTMGLKVGSSGEEAKPLGADADMASC